MRLGQPPVSRPTPQKFLLSVLPLSSLSHHHIIIIIIIRSSFSSSIHPRFCSALLHNDQEPVFSSIIITWENGQLGINLWNGRSRERRLCGQLGIKRQSFHLS